jgi:hypothetical protein
MVAVTVGVVPDDVVVDVDVDADADVDVDVVAASVKCLAPGPVIETDTATSTGSARAVVDDDDKVDGVVGTETATDRSAIAPGGTSPKLIASVASTCTPPRRTGSWAARGLGGAAYPLMLLLLLPCLCCCCCC